MKRIYTIFAALLLIPVLSFQYAFGCVPDPQPLRKDYRRAKSVFIGRLESITAFVPSKEERERLLPEDWDFFYKGEFSKVRFTVTKTWKEARKGDREFVAVISDSCECRRRQLKAGQDYLVLATGKNFVHICDAGEIETDITKHEIRRIDQFWFRVWATIYPF